MCFVFPDADAILRECDPVDFIVSNPPYLLSQDMKTLQTEILRLGQHADTLNMCFNLWGVFENSSCNLIKQPHLFPGRFEDHAALDGGLDGLSVIRPVLGLCSKLLTKRG